jgi:hypothetical protein
MPPAPEVPPTETAAPPPAGEAEPAATPTSGEPPPAAQAHRYVVSTKARKYYYCDSDPAWHGLAAANLEWYDTEAALLARYPTLVLHAPCKD